MERLQEKRRCSGIVLSRFFFGLCLCTSCALATGFYGGSGASADPFQIATVEQLMSIGSDPNLLDKHFVLMADIDLDPNLPGRKIFNRAVIAPVPDSTEGDSEGTPFTGVFDGRGHTISNLTIVGHDHLGLFGWVGRDEQSEPTTEINDLSIENARITGSGFNTGGLLATLIRGLVIQCHGTVTVSGERSVGGLIGFTRGTVKFCSSVGTVSGSSNVGGLAGGNRGILTDCDSACSVSGIYAVGGLVGRNVGSVYQCTSSNEVTGISEIGGLIGRIGYHGHRPYSGFLHRSCSTAQVRGDEYVGGLVGIIGEGAVGHCYSAGQVRGRLDVGGLIGYKPSMLTVTNCLWDIQTSTQNESAGGMGLTTLQMQDVQAYLDAGWDFEGKITNGTHETWRMPGKGGYPVLALLNGLVPPQLQGQGTAEDPYLISDVWELGAIIHYRPSATYRLTTSIDLSGIHWPRTVIPEFAGTFSGGGHTLSQLTIIGGDHIGFFGRLEADAIIRDFGLVDVSINTTGDYATGGMALSNAGHLDRCYVTGEVQGTTGVGGFVGHNSGLITNCYNAGTVSGAFWVGGLTISNSGTISNCYSACRVIGESDLGGFVSPKYRNPGPVVDSFWDIELSGLTARGGRAERTTAAMKKGTTFVDAGWDCIGEVGNGTEDIWWIDEGKDYPHFVWERE